MARVQCAPCPLSTTQPYFALIEATGSTAAVAYSGSAGDRKLSAIYEFTVSNERILGGRIWTYGGAKYRLEATGTPPASGEPSTRDQRQVDPRGAMCAPPTTRTQPCSTPPTGSSSSRARRLPTARAVTASPRRMRSPPRRPPRCASAIANEAWTRRSDSPTSPGTSPPCGCRTVRIDRYRRQLRECRPTANTPWASVWTVRNSTTDTPARRRARRRW